MRDRDGDRDDDRDGRAPERARDQPQRYRLPPAGDGAQPSAGQFQRMIA
jgi:hypothetical protein